MTGNTGALLVDTGRSGLQERDALGDGDLGIGDTLGLWIDQIARRLAFLGSALAQERNFCRVLAVHGPVQRALPILILKIWIGAFVEQQPQDLDARLIRGGSGDQRRAVVTRP